DKTPNVGSLVGGLAGRLASVLPVGEVDVSIAPAPYIFNQALTASAWTTLVMNLSMVRSMQQVPNDTFVYGVVEPCGSTSGIAGIGYVPTYPDRPDSGPYRTAAGFGDGWVFSHEVGHNLGRSHVLCSGAAMAPDASYPHGGGVIATWGWDTTTGTLQSPDHRDLMSYCSDPWVSDYGWDFAQDVLEGIASWSNSANLVAPEDPADGPGGIMGLLRADGTSVWWTTPETPMSLR